MDKTRGLFAVGLVGLVLGGAVLWSAAQVRRTADETRGIVASLVAESAQARPAEPAQARPAEPAALDRLADICASAGQARIALDLAQGPVGALGPLVGALEAVSVLGPGSRAQADAAAAGVELAAVGASLCHRLEPTTALLAGHGAGSADGTAADVVAGLVGSRASLVSAADSLERLARSLDELPPERRRELGAGTVHERAPAMVRSLRDGAALLGLFEGTEPRRFLLVSQNPDELRATGGYVGSAGVVEVDRGRIRLLEYGSSRRYDTPADLRVLPPKALEPYLGGGYWHLAGANWSPSFPDVARQMTRFYELGHPGQSVDGVVALDQAGLVLLLGAVGPVSVPEYGETVGPDDVQAKLDKYVHVDADETTRKQFTGALAAAVLRRIAVAPSAALPGLARAARRALEEQHLLIALGEGEAGRVVGGRGWDGGLLPAAGDALLVVDSEVSFSKQSQQVTRDVGYDVDLTDADRPTARLALTYTNRSVERPGQPFRAVYRTFVRAFVPAGAGLRAAEGLVGPVTGGVECGRTWVGGEVAIPAGGTARAVLQYDLPAAIGRPGYSLLLQQQPAAPPGATTATVRTSEGAATVSAPNGAGRHALWRLSAGGSPALEPIPLPRPDGQGCGVAPARAERLAPPTSLVIPGIGLEAPIVPLAVGADGALDEPPTPDVVGWYRMSGRPGQPGNGVLSGHLDWKGGPAVFARLDELSVGDEIVVRDAVGASHRYTVESNTSYRRAEAPVERLLRGSDDTLLTLITCDGTFDQSAKDYSHRRIVRAQQRS